MSLLTVYILHCDLTTLQACVEFQIDLQLYPLVLIYLSFGWLEYLVFFASCWLKY
jgi:hypothetical protein